VSGKGGEFRGTNKKKRKQNSFSVGQKSPFHVWGPVRRQEKNTSTPGGGTNHLNQTVDNYVFRSSPGSKPRKRSKHNKVRGKVSQNERDIGHVAHNVEALPGHFAIGPFATNTTKRARGGGRQKGS